jgi:putative flavoprotein involved in K+ transport
MTRDSQQYLNAIVIGGGQAGLALGYYLMDQKCDFIILDANEQVGDAWRHRWESLRLFTSPKNSSLPDLAFPASDNDFLTKDEMADYLEMYATRFDLPIRLNTTVESLIDRGDRYVVDTGSEHFVTDSVVVATGPFHHPTIPTLTDKLDSSIAQLHSSEYRRPAQLPDSGVLVVGAGNSGAEIAVELAATDRTVWLSGRDPGHIPLWFFNSSIFQWLSRTVLTVDTWIGQRLKQRTRNHGDPRIRLSATDIREAGIEWVSRVEDVTDGKPRLDDEQVLDVAAVIWATGFRPDFSWIELPIFGENGYPIQYRGVVDGESGLYFLGLPFQYTPISATIGGVGADARYIADHMQSEATSIT